MNTKAYIINLKFGIWENQLWLEAEDTAEKAEDWKAAQQGLDGIAKNCHNSGEYFSKAIEHFESHGFSRIQR